MAPRTDSVYTISSDYYTGSTSGTRTEGGSKSYDDIAWFANGISSVQASASSASGSKEASWSKYMKIALECIENIWLSASSDAENDSAEIGGKTAALAAEQENLSQNLAQDIDAIYKTIEEQIALIETKIEELNSAYERIEAEQEKVKTVKQEIENKKQELSTTSDPEKQKEILEEIQSLSGQLTEIIATLQEISDNAEQAQADIQAEEDKINTEKDNSAELTENYTNAIDDMNSGLQAEVAEINEQEAEALINNGVSQAATTITTTSGVASLVTFGATSGMAFQAGRVSADQFGAGSIRLGTFTVNLPKVISTIGSLSGTSSNLATFGTQIGGMFSDTESLLGGWSSVLDGTLRAVGSLASLQQSQNDLQSSVEADLQQVEQTPEDENTPELKTLSVELDNLEIQES